MQTETLVGLIGFGGAVVGAGGALLGGLLQSRIQARTLQEQRVEDRGREAANTALNELFALRRLASGIPLREPDIQPSNWRLAAHHHMEAAEVALMLMPQAEEVRRRALAALHLGQRAMILAGQAEQGPDVERRHLHDCSLEAINVLSTYMRGEPLPPCLGSLGRLEDVLRNTPAPRHDARQD
ncbi:hypothetical protein NC239_26660 [Streptomyces sp. G3]|uniref:hypothetical protein n=1 Tax=Streptomyces sp. G3 TaxID=690144 RepID=UPI00202DC4BD|nr:hypothetical protein [Streptomyces sp. G3]MCM1941785.1 hypothetical protein [Streptomyces sp. G3]